MGPGEVSPDPMVNSEVLIELVPIGHPMTQENEAACPQDQDQAQDEQRQKAVAPWEAAGAGVWHRGR